MCVSVLWRLCKENSHGKAHGCYIASLDGFSVSHEKWALFSSVGSSRPSAVWRFASSFRLWLLWSLHSRSRWPPSGMRQGCMKLYFLGHLQSHNLWYCARWTPIVMFTCWLCNDCLLNTWNLADQFSKLLSNDTWSFSFVSCKNRIPDRGSRTCCCSRTLSYLKACLLQIAFAPAGLSLPLCASIFEGIIFVTAQVCQGFPPLVNERKMGAWGQHHHLYGSSQSAVFHLSIQLRTKAISFWEQHPSYILWEPLLQTVRILGLLSALKNSVGSLPINDAIKTHGIYESCHIISHLDHHGC
jgi:hypothetical protein